MSEINEMQLPCAEDLVPEFVKARAVALKVRQKRIAKALRRDKTTVSQALSGKNNPRLLERINRFLDRVERSRVKSRVRPSDEGQDIQN